MKRLKNWSIYAPRIFVNGVEINRALLRERFLIEVLNKYFCPCDCGDEDECECDLCYDSLPETLPESALRAWESFFCILSSRNWKIGKGKTGTEEDFVRELVDWAVWDIPMSHSYEIIIKKQLE